MTALQAIVFDFDGVIANSEPLHLRAFQLALEDEGIAFSRGEYFSRYLGFDDVGMFEALARDRGVQMTDSQVSSARRAKGAEAAGADGTQMPFCSRARRSSSETRRGTGADSHRVRSLAARDRRDRRCGRHGGAVHDDCGVRRHTREQAFARAVPARVHAVCRSEPAAPSIHGAVWQSRILAGDSSRQAAPAFAALASPTAIPRRSSPVPSSWSEGSKN